MLVSVHVQVWGPFEASGANYRWITVGVIEDPKDFDLESLKIRAVEIIKNREYQPTTYAARLLFKKAGKVYMKTTFMDLWEV